MNFLTFTEVAWVDVFTRIEYKNIIYVEKGALIRAIALKRYLKKSCLLVKDL